jgi:hypothetical protein
MASNIADAPRDKELFAHVTAATREAIATVRSIQDGAGFILDYHEYPHLSWFDSGFPHLSTYISERVPRYRDAYRREDGDSKRVDFSQLQSFQQLQDFCLRSERLSTRLAHGRLIGEIHERWVRMSADFLAEHLMERFLHLHPDEEPTDDLLRDIYLPLEAPVLDDVLYFDVLVPVVLTHFPDLDEIVLNDSLTLRKLSDEEHLARWPLGPSTTESVNSLVLSSATHALVWAGHSVDADEWAQRHSNSIDGLPWLEIDMAFDAFRVVTGYRMGYAQVVLEPKGWVEEYVANLPPLIRGPQVRRYPEEFEDWGWLKDSPTITQAHLNDVPEALQVLSQDRHLQMAARRFSASLLRSEEDDSVVDLCTCLEILLTDETKTEVLHKLRLRAAAIVAMHSPGVDAKVVFKWVANVYALRSFLLHGSKSKKKSVDHLRKIKHGSDRLRTVDAARWISQTILLWTIGQGRLVPASEIDRSLILDALTQPAVHSNVSTTADADHPAEQ